MITLVATREVVEVVWEGQDVDDSYAVSDTSDKSTDFDVGSFADSSNALFRDAYFFRGFGESFPSSKEAPPKESPKEPLKELLTQPTTFEIALNTIGQEPDKKVKAVDNKLPEFLTIENLSVILGKITNDNNKDKYLLGFINAPVIPTLVDGSTQGVHEIAKALGRSNKLELPVKSDAADRVSIGDGKWLSAEAGKAYLRAQEQARAAGVIFELNSAGRTYQDQERLYNELKGVSAVAEPGTSNHEDGNAIDIQNYDEAKPFLLANGFVHGDGGGPIENDLWHFKYVGGTK